MKIGGAVGDPSGDGQCDHKPARFATYYLAVTEHIVGELPELAFCSFFSSEDSLHRGGREWFDHRGSAFHTPASAFKLSQYSAFHNLRRK